VPSGRRMSVNAAEYVTSYDVATKVTSDNPLVVERACYFSPGSSRVLGHCTGATTQQTTQAYLAEGATTGGFETWILLANFDGGTATAQVTFLTSEGEVPGPQVTVPSGRRVSVNAAEYVTSYDVATKVTSDNPLVVERACYFSPGSSRVLGHCASAAHQ
jgi:hypothetical protein